MKTDMEVKSVLFWCCEYSTMPDCYNDGEPLYPYRVAFIKDIGESACQVAYWDDNENKICDDNEWCRYINKNLLFETKELAWQHYFKIYEKWLKEREDRMIARRFSFEKLKKEKDI